jgi:hypothetical protein
LIGGPHPERPTDFGGADSATWLLTGGWAQDAQRVMQIAEAIFVRREQDIAATLSVSGRDDP